MIQQEIAQSGLTPDQIRARLQAAGYSPNLLDQYLGTQNPNQPAPTPGAQELSAIQALGLPPISLAPESLQVDTGFFKIGLGPPPLPPESLAVLPVFGVDVFKRTTTQFLPLLSGPVPPDYKVGPGDQLVLILTGDVEQTYSLPVTREGFILIPQVGQVYVANLTLDQLRSVLYTRLGRVYSGVRRGAGATTQFDISVANVGAVQVYVIGEVTQPGAYPISSLGTVLSALYAAGGVTDKANMRDVEVRRNGATISRFDLYDYLLHGDTRSDVRLQTGDVVFVGIHGIRASVTGGVRRQAIYEMRGHETLADLVADAGGFAANAALQRISIDRIVPPAQRTGSGPQRMVVDVPLTRGDSGHVVVPPFPVEDGDSIWVDTLANAQRNYVQIQGNVYQPGTYALRPGMKLSDLVRLAGGFQPATYTGRALISRLNPSDSTRSLVAVRLPRDSADAWPDDAPLQDYDIVTVYGRPQMRDSIYVAITGMVNQPGQYPWQAGMTLRDLMLMAGGPQIGADLQEAEIARMPADRSKGQLATTIRAPLDSTYLFDRDSSGRYVGPPGVALRPSGAPEVPIEPFDNVLILRQPDFEFQRTAQILGEVRYPGAYALTSKGERLSDLVARAGGLTPRAYSGGIRFIRSLDAAGRINVDLAMALRDTTSQDNLILQPGDSITIPEYEPSVRVIGAVNSPGSVLWQRGEDIGYYIDAAGGPTRLGLAGDASVTQANGQVQSRRHHFFFTSNPQPGPGSVVLVPGRSPTEQRTPALTVVGGIAQILASMLTLVVVAERL